MLVLSPGMIDLAVVLGLGIFVIGWGHRHSGKVLGRRILTVASALFALAAVYEFVQSEVFSQPRRAVIHSIDVSENGIFQISLQPSWSSGPPFANVNLERREGTDAWLSSDVLAPANLRINGRALFRDPLSSYGGHSITLAENLSISAPITLEYEVRDDTKALLADCQVRVYHGNKGVLYVLSYQKWAHRFSGMVALIWMGIGLILLLRRSKASR